MRVSRENWVERIFTHIDNITTIYTSKLEQKRRDQDSVYTLIFTSDDVRIRSILEKVKLQCSGYSMELVVVPLEKRIVPCITITLLLLILPPARRFYYICVARLTTLEISALQLAQIRRSRRSMLFSETRFWHREPYPSIL